MSDDTYYLPKGLSGYKLDDEDTQISLWDPYTEDQPKYEYKCECGADTVYGPDNNNFHSPWCPKYVP